MFTPQLLRRYWLRRRRRITINRSENGADDVTKLQLPFLSLQIQREVNARARRRQKEGTSVSYQGQISVCKNCLSTDRSISLFYNFPSHDWTTKFLRICGRNTVGPSFFSIKVAITGCTREIHATFRPPTCITFVFCLGIHL